MFVALRADGAPPHDLETLDEWIARVNTGGHTRTTTLRAYTPVSPRCRAGGSDEPASDTAALGVPYPVRGNRCW